MPLLIGNVITRNPYKANATYSDYGEIVFDNGATKNSTSNVKLASTFEWLKMIQDSLASINVTSNIVTYSNSTSNSEDYYTVMTLKFIIDRVEFMISLMFWNRTTNLQLMTMARDNASSMILRPRAPVSANIPYYNDTPEDMPNAEFSGFCGDIQNIMLWDKNIPCKVQAAVYDGVVYILTNAANQTPMFVISGRVGTGIGVGVRSFGCAMNPFVSQSSFRSQCAIANNDSNDWWGGSVTSALQYDYSVNSRSKVMGFPIYFTTDQKNSTSALYDACGAVAVNTKYLLAIANIPNINVGTRFANGTWICPSNPSSSTKSAILMPWDDLSPSVFDYS